MDAIVIRFSLIVALIYAAVSYFKGGFYEDYLIKSVLIFFSLALILLLFQYSFLKIFAKAKIVLLKENFITTYEVLKKQKEEREQRIKEQEEKMRNDLALNKTELSKKK